MDDVWGAAASRRRTPAYLERGSQRDTMLLLVAMRTEDGGESTLRVRNLSAGGLMAETSAVLAEGERVRIGLRAIGEVIAHVAWTEGGRIGLKFAAKIDARRVRQPAPKRDGPEIVLIPPVRNPRSSRPGLKRG